MLNERMSVADTRQKQRRGRAWTGRDGQATRRRRRQRPHLRSVSTGVDISLASLGLAAQLATAMPSCAASRFNLRSRRFTPSRKRGYQQRSRPAQSIHRHKQRKRGTGSRRSAAYQQAGEACECRFAVCRLLLRPPLDPLASLLSAAKNVTTTGQYIKRPGRGRKDFGAG